MNNPITPFTNELDTKHQAVELSHRKVNLGENEPLKLSVVGHTNVGKTSIIRTLLRDVYFGEVKNAPATTRHVEKALISDSKTKENLVALYDTPGLEDSTGLLDWLLDNTASRCDGVERLQQFLANDIAQTDFSQEAKVIRQLLASDIAIYVIDAREPVLGKYKDELTILSWSAVPVMPVFNFSHDTDSYIEDWQIMLARRNLHVLAKFDSVAFEFDDEMKLWQNLTTMLIQPQILTQLINQRTEDWLTLYEEANIKIAHFLLNIASFSESIHEVEDPLPTLARMQEKVRQAERSLQEELLSLYKFYNNTVDTTSLELSHYQKDPFDSDVLASYGLRTTGGMATGALIGLGIDTMALGTTLGLGTALGGLIGGIAGNGNAIADKFNGVKRLYIDPATLALLATRATTLLATLRHRGHASTQKVVSSSQVLTPIFSADKLPDLLKKARNKPQWSSLNDSKLANHAHDLRDESAWKLGHFLGEITQTTL